MGQIVALPAVPLAPTCPLQERCTVRKATCIAFGLVAAAAWGGGVAGQQDMVKTHIGHVTTGFYAN